MAKIDDVINGLSPQEVDLLNSDPQMLAQFRAKYGDEKTSIVRKAWDALAVPEKKSREGLGMIANAIPETIGGPPTGNLAGDVLRGAPRVAAETIAEVMPSMVSRGAILTAGASKLAGGVAPAAKMLMRGGGAQLESASGAVPGSLEAAYKDSSLLFEKGRKAASPLYEAAKAELPEGASIFKDMYKPDQILDAAKEYLDKGGVLEPAEALMARKAVDALMRSKSYVKDELVGLRKVFDGMAKASENIAKADPAHARGLMAESLRNFLPQNKYGGASAFKMGIAPALSGLGGYVAGPPGAAVGGALAAGVLSPIVQGAAATTAGILARNVASPIAGSVATAASTSAVLDRLARARRRKQ